MCEDTCVHRDGMWRFSWNNLLVDLQTGSLADLQLFIGSTYCASRVVLAYTTHVAWSQLTTFTAGCWLTLTEQHKGDTKVHCGQPAWCINAQYTFGPLWWMAPVPDSKPQDR